MKNSGISHQKNNPRKILIIDLNEKLSIDELKMTERHLKMFKHNIL